MTKRENLLSDLIEIQQNEYRLESREKLMEYGDLMLKYIGDPDPELRDILIYRTFYHWILEKEYFSEDQLLEILKVAQDEKHLFYKIGNKYDDTVFTRAFSVLLIALILSYHRENTFINQNLFLEVKDNLLKYYKNENDLRGYTVENGWADGISHAADAFDELIACEESSREIYLEVLEAVKEMLSNKTHIFKEEEDERITNILFRMVKKNLLTESELINWIDSFNEFQKPDTNREQRTARINLKNFSRSLYFRLLHSDVKSKPRLKECLIRSERRLNSFIRN
ncbi:DUF2785 domain-containing protein [Halanaerobium sp.]|uniref:DUF2785 domain-containing protein n=1 Tax=Halanaerobium sp. TaxID=1895664 RepID=UPI000DE5D4BA|nr:DUF2785 domain-containing protein [Halanaerobium sp.]PUU93671.1 MAG: hypothetical protein CI949_1274 [Halanaerobium sp.]